MGNEFLEPASFVTFDCDKQSIMIILKRLQITKQSAISLLYIYFIQNIIINNLVITDKKIKIEVIVKMVHIWQYQCLLILVARFDFE